MRKILFLHLLKKMFLKIDLEYGKKGILFLVFSLLFFFYSVNIGIAQTTLNLKFYIQGYYTGGGVMNSSLFNSGIGVDPNVVDTVKVTLHEPVFPYTLIECEPALLNVDGTCAVNFSSGVMGETYYISVCHQNAIQTTSAFPVSFTSITTYDFSVAINQAYGNNMVEVENGVWAFYSGDINNDCIIDNSDLGILNNAIQNAVSGYYPSDINADGFVDALDAPYVMDNIQLNIQNTVSWCCECQINLCTATTDSLIVNTGYNQSLSIPYDNDVSDGNWSITNTPAALNFPKPYSAWTISKHPAWDNELVDSKWISAQKGRYANYNNPSPDSAYTFEYCFCLCQADSVTFNLNAMCDDSAKIYLKEDPVSILGHVSSFLLILLILISKNFSLGGSIV